LRGLRNSDYSEVGFGLPCITAFHDVNGDLGNQVVDRSGGALSLLGRPIEGRKTIVLCIEALERFTMFSTQNVKHEPMSDRGKLVTDQNVPSQNIFEGFALASDR
jgi:hypothetical protein